MHFATVVLALVFNWNFYCLAFDLYEGDPCENSGSVRGTCTILEECSTAVQAITKHRHHHLTRCGFDGFHELVCCPQPSSKSKEACAKFNKLPIILSPLIINGENAAKKEFPHMAALGFYSIVDKVYLFNCGGTLISNQYVVTAAHCIVNIEEHKLKIVRLGEVDVPASVERPNPKMDYNVAKIEVHEDYKPRKKINDVALIRLEKTVTFTDFIRPACLYTKDDDPATVVVTGWGAIDLQGTRSNSLQKAVLTSRSLTQCNSTYLTKINRVLLRSQICAADLRSDSCQGDSGGPIQIQGNGSVFTIVGITSYGIGCGSKYPGVYTRIYSYLSWIEGIVWS